MLRVLVVLPFYGGSLPIGRFAAEGLKEAGALVDVFEAPDFFPAYEAIKRLRINAASLDSLQNSFLQVVSQAVLAKVDSFKPDLVLSMAQAPLNRMALRRLKKDGVTTAMWFVEDYKLFPYWRAFAPSYDIFAVIQKEPFLGELAALGVANPLYLPLAALPSLHKPLELTPQERKEFGSRLSFLGAGYPNRRKAFLRFKEMSLKIWGTEWEGEPGLAPLIQRGGARISPEDAVRIFNATDININLHSSIKATDAVCPGDFVNPRTFEVAACGGFQLVDKRSLMVELFDDGELATFETLEDLANLAAYYTDKPEERAAIAGKARQRVLKEHTYAIRMARLLDFAKTRITGFGSKAKSDWPEHMPEEMRIQTATLLQELQLPEDVPFDDLIAAVHQKSGVLSDAEAALLFLDEWRKLYLR